MFPRADGAPWSDHDYRNWRKRIFRPAAIATGRPDLRPYDLRHAFVSLMLAEGRGIVDVAAQAGHAPSMSFDTYGHLIAELDETRRRPATDVIREARDACVRSVCDMHAPTRETRGVDSAASVTNADALLDPREVSLADVVKVSLCGFDVAPADTSLALKERNRSTGDEHHLAELLADANAYDVALIDCPPSLGVLTVNALVAADRFLLVADASHFALQGIARLLETVSVVRRYFDPSLELAGLVVNLTDHTRETQRRILEGEAHFGRDALRMHLPRRVVVKEAIASGRTLRSYGDDRGADDVVGRVDFLAAKLVPIRVG